MRTRTLLALAIAVTAVPVAVQGVLRPAADVRAATTPALPWLHARRVLRRWDVRRSDAWARGDRAALGQLYLPGSRTGAADAAALLHWTRRGLRVTGLRQQVWDLRVVRERGSRLVVLVTERTVGGLAVAHGVRTPLPASGWDTHRVALVRGGAAWRVAEVRDQPAR